MLDIIGQLVDLAFDHSDVNGLEKALNWVDQAGERELSAPERAILFYFKANCWANIQILKRKGKVETWDWEQVEFEQQIICLRNAIRAAELEGFPVYQMCQVYTNLANTLNSVGRFVEAIHYWNKAIDLKNDFSMAIGNFGYALFYYAQLLYDHGHSCLFLRFAHNKLHQAINGQIEGDALTGFIETIQRIENMLRPDCLKESLDMEGYSLGDTPEEKRYRGWCLKERLFLNPLNDLGPYPIANQDVLTCPSIVAPIGEGPVYHAFYNALKQEFVSARWLTYEGIFLSSTHFSDKDVLLYNTLDSPIYGISIQKTCLAFRLAYSLFDKIAFFLNSYLDLEIHERKVNFRTIWYKNQRQKEGLREEFRRKENLPLRGLFWLSKDFYCNDHDFREAIEPESKDLQNTRNHLEHKYLKIHDNLWHGRSEGENEFLKPFDDTLAHSVYREEFERKTINILKLARAALIYLSLGIQAEEKLRTKSRSEEKIVPPIMLDLWDDDWKW